MNKPNPPNSSDHPDDLLLPYLEHELGPEESTAVGEHVAECLQCRNQLEELRRVVVVLRDEKTVFCPETCALYEFAVNGVDPGRKVARHLETCGACREEVSMIRPTAEEAEGLSDDLWVQIQERLPKKVSAIRPSTTTDRKSTGFLQSLFSRFAVPKLAAATAAAMILVLVLSYQGEMVQPTVAVSTIAWENAPKPKTTDTVGRKRVAPVILLNDFQKNPPQKMIDSLYQALEPDLDMSERYDLLPPAELKHTVNRLRFSEENMRRALEALRNKSGASQAVLVTITPSGDNFSVQGEVRDTATDALLSKKKTDGVSLADLPSKAREIVRALLFQ